MSPMEILIRAHLTVNASSRTYRIAAQMIPQMVKWVKGCAPRKPLRHKALGRIAQLVEQLTLNQQFRSLFQCGPAPNGLNSSSESIKQMWGLPKCA